jgi:hypothetical protein
MDWQQLLAYITGSADQELLLRNEYLVTESHLVRHESAQEGALQCRERLMPLHVLLPRCCLIASRFRWLSVEEHNRLC